MFLVQCLDPFLLLVVDVFGVVFWTLYSGSLSMFLVQCFGPFPLVSC